ncbi:MULTISPECIES: HlyD family type I secretion periplasmic adaptor subunit [unclassified Pseudomonas]|uniref:HlyD family type I secretion periplasmic adaptor subunit n=1 Tax=unclassified Pseudomonas TaxID=196821 RepID=UPI000BC60BF6|nr:MULTISPECIES: HlyD family type I secretion periplasmic adaptor subunit [unclassified Pseudomonas]PVZ19458.1 protease secretion system membrane fusion protein [Pseudomonas sp. URIL14HWK12:I12]PVZ22957.1 protease secretion system membrane fusion protein [Pseudomonas sp. URIL14HWK12:I10]PVZ37413.1 protease secretion system membrane fusion protein [Pseudomonas sp. URIL14HWK12:I11]SNZ14722.1 membrane fusion protein, protease secretion system [Pseudomonas sp. URIL14HWK12:I9]
MADLAPKRPLVEVPKPARQVASIDAASTARRGLWFLLIALGGFLAWAFLAPLDQGVVGQGTVVVAGERKTVQPLVAGVVQKILVNEGDLVKQGQLLVQLNTVQAQAQLDVNRGKLITARATEARLTAERLRQSEITWPPELLAQKDDPRAKAAMALQQNLFATRAAELKSRQGIVEHQISADTQQLKAYQEVRANYGTQLKFQQEELVGLRDLAKDGYVPRAKLFEAERNSAQMAGQLATSIGDIGKTQQSINESKLKLLQQDQEFRRDAETQLSDIAAQASGYADQIAALEFEVANGALRAPVDGQVLDLTVHTIGGVATAGQALMSVVPLDSPLSVTARFQPMMANKLKPGLPVQVHFTALQRVDTPVMVGKVTTVSADQLIDQQTHQPYFSARVELPPDSLAKLRDKGLPVKPGMLADVTVVTGERTLVNYLMKPLRERLLAAFKEE